MDEYYYSSKRHLVDRGMYLWRVYGESYRTLIPEYEAAIAYRRENNLAINKVPNSVILELPEIPFLKIEDEEAAKQYLVSLVEQSIKSVIWGIEDLKYNRAWNGMRSNIIDVRYSNNRTNPKCPFGLDPERRTGRSKHHRSRRTKDE